MSQAVVPPRTTVWNVPNRLSAIRLGLSIFTFVFISVGWYWAAFIVFVVAAGTDWVDGWWARKFDQVTKLGRILDPFCDKVLVCGTYILLAVAMREFPWYAAITGWIAVVVFGREILVTGIRGFIEQSGGDFSAKMAGKVKMWFQCIAAGACLLALAVAGEGDARVEASQLAGLPDWLWTTLAVSVWLAVLSTLWSGYLYVMLAIKSVDLGGR
jgi:CDP-diacylglycerol--glycerol-3-phosphate 3-phosphatidyltransferase